MTCPAYAALPRGAPVGPVRGPARERVRMRRGEAQGPRAAYATAVRSKGPVAEVAAQGLLEPGASVGVHRGDRLACGPDAVQVGLPPLLEAGVGHRHRQLDRLHVAQAGAPRGCRPGSRVSRPGSRSRRDARARPPPPPATAATSGPASRRGPRRWRRPSRPVAGDARHLGDPGDRVGHEVHDQARGGDVERSVGEGQRLGGAEMHVDAGQALAARRDERLGRVDGAPRGRSRAGPPARRSARPVRSRRRPRAGRATPPASRRRCPRADASSDP